MSIELKKPFAEYVDVEKLPKTGDADKFVIRFAYVVENTGKAEIRRLEWRYSDTQRVVDDNAGVDGEGVRRKRNIELLQHAIEKKLKEKGERLYAVAGQKIPVWGKK